MPEQPRRVAPYVAIELTADDVQRYEREFMPDPIHTWFGLSYASYLVLPRSILQSMPWAWQQRLVRLLDELEVAAPEMPEYQVEAVGGPDPYEDYERGRRVVPLAACPCGKPTDVRGIFADQCVGCSVREVVR